MQISPLYELLGYWVEQKWTTREMAERLGIDPDSLNV